MRWSLGWCLVCSCALMGTASAQVNNTRPSAPSNAAPVLGIPPGMMQSATTPPVAAPAVSSPATGPSVTAPPASTPTRPLAPVTQRQPAAADLVIALLEAPDGAKLEGEWIALRDVLAAVSERDARLAAATAYWNLSAALAQCNAAWDEVHTFEQLGPIVARQREPAALLELETRLESAKALRRDAEATFVARQAEVAGLMRSNKSLLPADPPHVGRYDTKFEQIFNGRTAPVTLRLLDRSLPWRHESIVAHARALQAAYDAADSALESYRAGRVSWGVLSDCYTRLAAERRAFIESVRVFNEDIATYALGVAPGGMTSAALTALLIMPPAGEAAPIATTESGAGVAPARFDAPASGQPTLAPPRGTTTNAAPAAGPTTTIPGANDIFGRQGAAASTTAPPAAGTPANSTPQFTTPPLTVPLLTPPPLTAPPNDSTVPRRANRPAGSAPGMYDALLEMPAARRAQELTETLHWDRDLPDKDGASTELSALLSASADRANMVRLYWQAREGTARYQATAERCQQLGDLTAAAIALRDRAGGAESMLRLRQARLAADAALVDARIDWLRARAMLSEALPTADPSAWPLPVTVPHGGGYRTVESADARVNRQARQIQTLHESLEHRAKAVVLLDFERAQSVADFEAGTAPLDDVLSAIDSQQAETLAFLGSVTEYNEAIADYALAAMPRSVSAAQLASALVLPRK